MRSITRRIGIVALALVAIFAIATSEATAASAKTTRLTGRTTVTTAPGIATTLLKLGVLPLPLLPSTRFGVGFKDGQIVASYGFPITSGNPDLAAGTGDILHRGGIYFVSRSAHLSISRFDIDLAAGKVFATRVNGAPARVPVLDLDLANLKVGSRHGYTVLSGIVVRLDAVAAGVLNSTFHVALPADGSLVFGTARVVVK